MPRETPRMRLASLLLQRPVLDFIQEHRSGGKTWQQVALALRDATDGEIAVSWQAVQQWANRCATADVEQASA